MNKGLWDFFGVSRTFTGEADRILDNIMTSMFKAIDELLNMPYTNYESIQNMIEDGISRGDGFTYFWEWFKEYGINSLTKIGSSPLVEDDDTLDYLDDRLFIINSDIENGLISSVFESIASTFTAIEALISSREETASDSSIIIKPVYKTVVHVSLKDINYIHYGEMKYVIPKDAVALTAAASFL